MQLQYDADLIENVVFLETRRLEGTGQRLLVARYDRQRTKLYEITDEDARQTAFYELHRQWFRDFGLEDKLLAALKQFPLIQERASTLLIRKAVSKKDEGAELFVRPDARNVAVAFRSERLFEPGFDPWLRHELCHISDMLDDTFAYEPEIALADLPATELDLLRERYRVLWDITIDGRLKHDGEKAKRLAEFSRALLGRDAEVFERLWSGPRPTHAELMTLATIVCAKAQHEPGGSCPLCRFPTFQWAGGDELTPAAEESVRQHFPQWTRARGCCARCAELYSMRPLEQPATLFV